MISKIKLETNLIFTRHKNGIMINKYKYLAHRKAIESIISGSVDICLFPIDNQNKT